MVGYCAGASFSGYFSIWVDGVSYFWLPSGLYLGILLLTSPRQWWIVVVGAGLGDLCFNRVLFPQWSWPLSMLLTAHLGNSVSAVLGAALVRHFVAPRPLLRSLREFALIIVLGGCVALVPTSVSGALLINGWSPEISLLSNIIAWYSSDLLGVLLVTPFILLWTQPRTAPARPFTIAQVIEGTVLGYGLIVLTTASFLVGWPERTETLYASFPFVIWAAVRFGRRGAAATILIAAIIAHWFNAFGYGSIGSSDLTPAAKSIEMLLSIGLFVLVGMVPAIVISNERRAEARARQSEQRRAAAVRSSNAATWELHLPTQQIEISGRFRKLLGFGAEPLHEPLETFLQRMSTDDINAARRAIGALRDDASMPLDVDVRFPDAQHQLRWFNLRGALVQNHRGPATHLTGSLIEITERKQLEARVQQADKLAVIGQLAGGVAHDFNNLLAAMIMNIELLQIKNPRGPIAESLGELHGLSKRATRLTEQLLMFARRRSMQLEPVELAPRLEELSRLLRRLLPENIELQIDCPTGLWIAADPAILDQALLNLCVNARDAMPRGGQLHLSATTIETRSRVQIKTNQHTPAPPPSSAPPSPHVRLSVRDTGVGISDEDQSHLFEPFFTTKGPGKGTGLGLASADGIVHQHNGWIEVDSTPGRGTTFTLFIPTIPAPRSSPATAKPNFPSPPRQEVVLYVEDEAAVRKATSAMLEELGYTVIAAHDADHARHCLAEHPGAVHLLFSDIVMPGETDGITLGRELRAADPALRILLTSGYSQQILAGSNLSREGFSFLPKPFDRRSLATALRAALDAPIA